MSRWLRAFNAFPEACLSLVPNTYLCLDDLQLFLIPAPENPMPSSSPCGHSHVRLFSFVILVVKNKVIRTFTHSPFLLLLKRGVLSCLLQWPELPTSKAFWLGAEKAISSNPTHSILFGTNQAAPPQSPPSPCPVGVQTFSTWKEYSTCFPSPKFSDFCKKHLK